jgi:hypothetical protein
MCSFARKEDHLPRRIWSRDIRGISLGGCLRKSPARAFFISSVLVLTVLITIGFPNNSPNVNSGSSIPTPKWAPASLLNPRDSYQPQQQVQNKPMNNAPPQRLAFEFDSPRGSSQPGFHDRPSLHSGSTEPSGFLQYANGNGGMGMGHMLERMHNVASRDMLPQKRRKLYDDRTQEDPRKAGFHGGGKGSIIGEYMRENKDGGHTGNSPGMAAVDISTG